MGKFIITTRRNGEFQFTLKAGNGQVLLSSEGYSSKAGCLNGIESVKINSQDEAKFDRKISLNGKPYFNLKTNNGAIIGSSEMYESEASRDNGILSVINNSAKAEVFDDTIDYLIDSPSQNNNQLNTNNTSHSLRINKITANKIGPFKKIDISFNKTTLKNKAEIHILTGQNGTGKSTILQLLSCCVPKQETSLAKKFWSTNQNDSNFSIQFSDNFISTLNFLSVNSNYNYKDNLPSISNLNSFNPIIKHYYLSNNKNIFDIAFFAYSGYRKLSDSTIDSIINIDSSPFESALDFDKSTNTKTFVNWLANIITKKALATIKKNNKDDNRVLEYEKTINYIQDTISDITGQKVEFDLQEDPLKIIIYVNESPLDFEQLPDGLKSIISWIGDLIMRLDRINWKNNLPLTERHFILFLDEIEIHLHPAWQRKILPIIQKLFINAQIFVSTHSPFVVGSVDGAWVYQFKLVDNESVLDTNPIPSEDSYSYEYILSEIFGVRERFGIDVEKYLTEFSEIKKKIISNNSNYDINRFHEVIDFLRKQSIEVQNIVGMEIRQLNRLMNNEFIDL